MLKIELDLEELQAVINDAVDKALERHAVKNELPPVLSAKQLQNVLGVSKSKAFELMKRTDFPVLRAAGHPKVPTKQLLEWIDLNTKWIRENVRE